MRRPALLRPAPSQSNRLALVAVCTTRGLASACGDASDGLPADLGAPDPAEVRSGLVTAIEAIVERSGVPGLSAGIVLGEELAWSEGFGRADLKTGREMTAGTVQNIGSVSKTVTATAVLQLFERGELDLDADVGELVGFAVRNPRFPNVPITVRQLLVHRSSIVDGDAYEESYGCGDPEPLEAFLKRYFTAPQPNSEAIFHSWEPGTLEPPADPRAYSNVGYGLLGLVVEKVSGLSFEEFTRMNIFEPLGMSLTGWRIDEIDADSHAVPYSVVESDFDPDARSHDDRLPRYSAEEHPPVPGEPFPHCLYSFGTPPDGLLRTSVEELALFLAAWLNQGQAANGHQLLKAETVAMALSNEHYGRALCWSLSLESEQDLLWGHSGGDPGIATFVGFRPNSNDAILLFFNTSEPGQAFGEIARGLLAAAPAMSQPDAAQAEGAEG